MAALWIFCICQYNTNFLQAISSGRFNKRRCTSPQELLTEMYTFLNYIHHLLEDKEGNEVGW